MLNKKYLLSIIFTLLLLLSPTLILAQADSTSSGTLDEDSIKQSIQDRIKKAIEKNLDSAQQTLDEAQEPQAKAFVGLVDSISESAISLNVITPDGSTTLKQVTIIPDTQIIKSGADIDATDIAIGQKVVAMGITSDNQVLEGVRVVVESIPTLRYQTIYSAIQTFDEDEQTISFTQASDGIDQPLDILSSTDLLDLGLDDIDLKDFNSFQSAIAVVLVNSSKDTTSLKTLIGVSGLTPSSTPSSADTCGDGICQDSVCMGDNCPTPESSQNCPADCQ